jgi:hypothetical protein
MTKFVSPSRATPEQRRRELNEKMRDAARVLLNTFRRRFDPEGLVEVTVGYSPGGGGYIGANFCDGSRDTFLEGFSLEEKKDAA